MNLETQYQTDLVFLRNHPETLNDYSVDAASDDNYNQIKRNRILIALYNDLQEKDYAIVDFIFNEQVNLRTRDIEMSNADHEVLYLSAYLLSTYERVEDYWKFVGAKELDFDSSTGFDSEYLLAAGVDKVRAYLQKNGRPGKDEWLLDDEMSYTQEDIDRWKEFKRSYYKVFAFPIRDEIDFAFQAKEFNHLEKIMPAWMERTNDWTEDQHLTAIAICRELELDAYRLKALKSYNAKFVNKVRVKMNEQEIAEIEKMQGKPLTPYKGITVHKPGLLAKIRFWIRGIRD